MLLPNAIAVSPLGSPDDLARIGTARATQYDPPIIFLEYLRRGPVLLSNAPRTLLAIGDRELGLEAGILLA
jgi:hypothetical protein